MIDPDELALRICERWMRRGIVNSARDDVPASQSHDEFEDEDDIVFRASQAAVDVLVELGIITTKGHNGSNPQAEA